jgi:hypothetical protein
VAVGAGLAIVCLLTRVACRAGMFYLLNGVAGFIVLGFAYWMSPDNLPWYLEPSASRSIDTIAFVGIVAALVLTLEIDAQFAEIGGTSGAVGADVGPRARAPDLEHALEPGSARYCAPVHIPARVIPGGALTYRARGPDRTPGCKRFRPTSVGGRPC